MQIHDIGLQFKGALQKRTMTDYIILHHAAASEASVTVIHDWHLKRGWLGIGYHFYIRKDGSIYRGRDEDAIGAHTEGYNSQSIGICAEGNYEVETMPDAQEQAMVELLRELKKKYPNAQIKRHKDFAATTCPGRNFPFDEIVKEVEGMLLKVRAKGEDVKKLQETLNKLGFDCGTVDGIFGPETESAVKAFQRAYGLVVDGIVGPATLAKIEELLKAEQQIEAKMLQDKIKQLEAESKVLQDRIKQLEAELQTANAKVLTAERRASEVEKKLADYKTLFVNLKKIISEV